MAIKRPAHGGKFGRNSKFKSHENNDVHGREVATVLDKKLPAGEHAVQFDITGLPEGVYFVELRAKSEGQRAVSKLVVH